MVELVTLYMSGNEVDVLTVKNTTYTPYFLIDDFKDGRRVVQAYHIYTRVCDTNTDIDKGADINMIEYLWKKRFLLTRSPFEQLLKMLESKDEWKREEDTYFHVYRPEFTIRIELDEEDLKPEFYSYAMMNESTSYKNLQVNYFGTKLYGSQVVVLDSGRYSTPIPDRGFLHFDEYRVHPVAFRYFVKGDATYKFHGFLYDEMNEEQRYARQRLLEVVLVFENSQENDAFVKYVELHKDCFLGRMDEPGELYSWTIPGDELLKQVFTKRLKTGKVLNLMLHEFRASGLFGDHE